MPYLLNPANMTQTFRPNLYNMAYRRIGAYKGMGRLHPSNYLEIGTRPNRIGATSGQYNTLSGQLSLNPPSLRGLGTWEWRRKFWRHGLGQSSDMGPTTFLPVGPPNPNDPAQVALYQMNALAASGGVQSIPADYGTGANILNPATGQVLPGVFTAAGQPSLIGGIDNNTLLLIGGGLLILLLAGGRR